MDYALPVWVLDVVIVFFLLEWVCLYFYVKRHPKGLNLGDMSFALAPGFFLILGFRFTATDSISAISLAFLFFAGVLHALDLYWRHIKAKSKQSLIVSEGSA